MNSGPCDPPFDSANWSEWSFPHGDKYSEISVGYPLICPDPSAFHKIGSLMTTSGGFRNLYFEPKVDLRTYDAIL